LATARTLAGDFGQATRSLEEAAADAETVWGAGLSIGDQPGARQALNGLAALAVKQDRHDHASRLAAAAEVLYAGPLSWGEDLMHAPWLRELPPCARRARRERARNRVKARRDPRGGLGRAGRVAVRASAGGWRG
jgi:hypothetical protein